MILYAFKKVHITQPRLYLRKFVHVRCKGLKELTFNINKFSQSVLKTLEIAF